MQCLGAWRRQVLNQHLGDFGGNVPAPLGQGAYGRNQIGRVACLVQITLRPGAQAAQGVLVFGEHRDNQHPHRRARLAQACQHFQATAPGKIQVEHQHVAGHAAHQLAYLGVTASFAHDLDVHRLGQGVADAAAHHCVIVTENHLDHGLATP